MKNKYEIRGEITVIFIKSHRFGDLKTIVSTDKLNLISDVVDQWYVKLNNRTDSFYVCGKTKHDNYKTEITLHRLIVGFPQGLMVDHINHDTLDNRDSNLRAITNMQNQQNRKGSQRNSSTGIRGVHWHKHSGKWEAQIKINRKKITIGYYSDIKEAEVAVIRARNTSMPYSENDKVGGRQSL